MSYQAAGADAASSTDVFSLAFEAAPTAMVMVDGQGRIALVNAQAERDFGYARGELLGRAIETLLPERFLSRHPGLRAGFLADPRPRPMGAGRNLAARRKDGSEFPVEIGLNPIETSAGPMVLSAIVDITRRKADEQALRESQHRARALAAIVESSEDAIIGSDLDGIVTSWNRSAERIFGYAEAEMVGQPPFRIAAPGYEAEMRDILARVRGGERISHYLTQRRRADGARLDISLSVSPIYDLAGDLVGVSKVARDVTAATAAEAALKETQAELLHVSRLGAMGELASALAHEINQPLTAISNYMKGSRRLRGFVSRGESEKRPETLEKLIEDALALGLVGQRERNIAVRRDYERGAWVMADRVQIQQVLVNLVRNACEAMADCERRELTVRSRDLGAGLVEIAVSDTGRGLPESVRPNLFRPFFTTKESGMGVGLSISRSIVEGHGGELSAYDRPEGGAEFTLTLPRAGARSGPLCARSKSGLRLSAKPAPMSLSLCGETRMTPRTHAGAVYVVDDDPAVLSSLRFLFETEGFRVETFSDGEGLLAGPAPSRSDCLLIDYKLGAVDGLELVRRLRAKNIETPALLFTIYEGLEKKAAAAGVDLVLLKSNLLENVVGRVETAMAAARRRR